MVCTDGGEPRGWGDAEKRIRTVALPHRRGWGTGAHLVGSPFLLLDALLVGGHRSGVGRGKGIVVSVASAVGGVLRGLVLCWGVV